MSKNIIIVQNVFNDPSITKHSIESIRHAAKRWGADFYELNTIQSPNSANPFFWDRLWEYENFTGYEKVLVLDLDVVVNSKAPNIFDELTPDFDFCAVKDGNPGGRFKGSYSFRDSIVKNISTMGNTVEIFQKNIDNFSEEEYWENYFNLGVTLFRPNVISEHIKKIKSDIFNNSEIYDYVNFKSGGIWFSSQNLINAIFTAKKIKIKFLGDEWNWLAPDISDEYHEDLFLGPMKPWVYHFTGTNNAKEALRNYERWI